MINREELNGKELKEVQVLLETELMKYQVSVETMDMEGLNAEEAMLVESMNAYDEYLNGVTYELPKSIEYGGKTYMKNTVANRIVDFVNKMEVEWQYTLGMYQMVEFWKNVEYSVEYKVYDSTLRILGQVKYKGYDEWKDILAINDFLSVPQELYARDNIYMVYLSQMHNSVLNRMDALNKVEMVNEINEVPEVEE